MWTLGRKSQGVQKNDEDDGADSVAICIGETRPRLGRGGYRRPYLWLVAAEQYENGNMGLVELRTGARIGFAAYEPLFLRSWHVVV